MRVPRHINIPDVVLNNLMANIFIFCDFIRKNVELQRICMQKLKILAWSLKVKFHVMLREVVDFIAKAIRSGKETHQVITYNKRMLKVII